MLSTVLAPFGSACRVCCAASRRHLPPSYPRNDFRLPLHVQRRTRLAHNCLLVALLCCHPWSAQPTVPQPTTLSLPCSLALSLSRYLTHYLRLSRGCSHHSHNPIQSTLDHRIQQYTYCHWLPRQSIDRSIRKTKRQRVEIARSVDGAGCCLFARSLAVVHEREPTRLRACVPAPWGLRHRLRHAPGR